MMSTDQAVKPETKRPEPVLTPVLSTRYALTFSHLLITGLFCALLLTLNLLPLRNTDLWCHVAYGQWMVDHQQLATEDPWMPLAEGVPAVQTAWLSQLILAKINAWAGPEGLSNLFALTVWLGYLFLARAFYLQTRNVSMTFFGTLLVLMAGWSRLTTIRPEMFSALCFAVLLWMLVRSGWTEVRGTGESTTSPNLRSRALWLGVPALFLLWANLHGSFVCGLIVLSCYTLGRMIEVAWHTHSPRAVLADRGVRSWLILTELAAAATLVNLYGMDLWIDVATFSANTNLRDLLEWTPLVILGIGGREFAVAVVLLLIAVRHSRRSMSPSDVLLLAVFAALAVVRVRMISWFAPVFGIVVVPHLADLWAQFQEWRAARKVAAPATEPADEHALPPGRSWRYSLVCVMLVWVAFAFSGFSRPLLGGKPRGDDTLYDDATPLGVVKFLKEHPPEGLVYNPEWWGDWMVWAGPQGIKPYAMTHVHLLPRQVWRDYRRISFAEPGWDTALDRYNINTLVIDKKVQTDLAGIMKRAPGWTLRYDDDQAMVLTRKPRPTADKPEAEATAQAKS